jgi:hypothetical protein
LAPKALPDFFAQASTADPNTSSQQDVPSRHCVKAAEQVGGKGIPVYSNQSLSLSCTELVVTVTVRQHVSLWLNLVCMAHSVVLLSPQFEGGLPTRAGSERYTQLFALSTPRWQASAVQYKVVRIRDGYRVEPD